MNIIKDVESRVAVVTLGKIDDERRLGALLQALHTDPDERVRRSIILTLGEMCDIRALPALLQIQQSVLTDNVQRNVAYAVRRLRHINLI